MRIALEDGFAVEKGTGIGQYTLNLSRRLGAFPEIESIHLIEKPFLSKVPSAALRRILYIAWLNSKLQLLLRREKVDIVHFTNYLVPTLRFSNAKYVVTIYDLTAWRFPETLPPAYIAYIKGAVSHAVKAADLIFTLSDAVKREIIELFEIDSERIRTVYSGIAQSFWEAPKKRPSELRAIRDKYGISQDFLLFIGVIEKRKNVITLVKAFEILMDRMDLQLVLVGRPGYGFRKVEKYIRENHLRGKVILTGYVSEEEKLALYDSATLFVYPSLYEGFGIPLVEAMVRKVPIVASKIPSTEEVAGEAAIYYEDLLNHEALAERILELIKNDVLRQDLVEKGLKRACDFSWEKVSKRHLQAYRELLEVSK